MQAVFEFTNETGRESVLSVEDDVCARKHGGAETSVEANRRVNKAIGEQMIINYLATHKDGTLTEICGFYGKQKNELSGRFKTLREKKGRIAHTGERRGGCYVYKLAS